MSSNNPHVMGISNPGDGLTLIYPYVKRYIHVPLQTPDSIRVLELLPGMFDSALYCRILEIPRTPPDIEFEAISYVWGSSVPACYLHDVESSSVLRITENLCLALRALRYPDRSRVIWADAVCIDQSDNDEKSHQVRNMGSVYATANTVIAWLGDLDLSEAFKLLQGFEDAPKSDMPTADPELIGPLDSVMAAVLMIVGSPWFTRLWIIQEFVLARDVQIWAGNHYINYKTLGNVMANRMNQLLRLRLDLLKDRPLEHLRPSLGESVKNYLLAENLIAFRAMWRDQSRPGSRQISLYECCRIVHHHPPKCTDERDLIYALLGLAKQPTKVMPNYNLSVTNVFLDFTWSEITNGNINILRDAEFLGQGDLYPSFLYRPDNSCELIKSHFGAQRAGLSRAPCAEAITPASIRIRGVVVDRISGCWRPSPVLPSDAEHRLRLMRDAPQTLEEFLLSAQVLSSSDEHITNPAGIHHNPGASHPVRSEITSLLDVYRDIQAAAKRIIDQNPMRKEMASERVQDRFWRVITLHTDSTSPAIPDDFRVVPRDFIYDVFYSHVFTTVEGYVGKASGHAEVDDLVVIFDGGDVPFVIRKARGESSVRWRLVGECYVDGWMDGSYYGHEVVDNVDQHLAAADVETNTGPSCGKGSLLSEYFVLC